MVDAYRAFGDHLLLETALKNACFIRDKMLTADGLLVHSYKSGRTRAIGFLEDYAWVIRAFLSLFETTMDHQWLQLSQQLTDTAIQLYLKPGETYFRFTRVDNEELIAPVIEITDNVIPASNSVMAGSLVKMSKLTDVPRLREMALSMVAGILPQLEQWPAGFSNWSQVVMDLTTETAEVAVCGPEAAERLRELMRCYLPGTVFCGSTGPSDLPLLKNRFKSGETLIYICHNNSCLMPVKTSDEAIGLLYRQNI